MNKFNVTDDEIIEYADILIIYSSPIGFVFKDALILYDNIWDTNYPKELKGLNELLRNRLNDNGGFGIVGEFSQSLFDRIKDHLKYNDYLLPFDNILEWKLNDNGKLCKRLKGHYKYINYLDKKIDAEIAEINGKINWKSRVGFGILGSFIFGVLATLITNSITNKDHCKEKRLDTLLSILANEKTYHEKIAIDSSQIQQKINAKYDTTKQTRSTNSQQ